MCFDALIFLKFEGYDGLDFFTGGSYYECEVEKPVLNGRPFLPDVISIVNREPKRVGRFYF